MNRLVAKGYKVAICEQMEDPKQAKGMVRREVIRVVTPGTNINEQALDEGKNNYIMCIVSLSDQFGVATADVTTGDFFVTEVDSKRRLLDEIYKFSPTEVVCNEALFMSGLDIDDLKNRVGIVGEILVKYMPLANNDLVKVLEREGAEAVVPELLGFMEYCFETVSYTHLTLPTT